MIEWVLPEPVLWLDEAQMSVAKDSLFAQMARDEAERLVQARMDRIDSMDENQLRVLLISLESHIAALEAEKQYGMGRLVELVGAAFEG